MHTVVPSEFTAHNVYTVQCVHSEYNEYQLRMVYYYSLQEQK